MRFRLFVLVLFFSLCASARVPEHGMHQHPASSSQITYVGRFLQQGQTMSADWSGVYMRISFMGRSLMLYATDSCTNYYNIWIDHEMSAEPDTVVQLLSDAWTCLYQDGEYNSHSLIMQKRTEAEQGRVTLHAIRVDGMLLQAEPIKARQIEFIGDSYTCGYGVESKSMHEHFSPQTENVSKTYADIICRYFDAECIRVSHSGMGIVRNYNSKYPNWTMPCRYRYTFDMDSTAYLWDAASAVYRPQLTVIYLGGNDFSCGMQPVYESFRDAYIGLLVQIKANYGAHHPILCVSKPNDAVSDYVRRIVEECQMTEVYRFANTSELYHYDDDDMGADYHPNYRAHKKLACTIIPYVSTIMGWDMPVVPIQ